MAYALHKWFGVTIVAVAFFILPAQLSHAEKITWGPWEPTGFEGISVSFSTIMPIAPQKNSITWKFINQTDKTISWFKYQWDDASGHQSDTFDYSLKPGAIKGGWNAANFGPLPISNFKITEVHFKGE